MHHACKTGRVCRGLRGLRPACGHTLPSSVKKAIEREWREVRVRSALKGQISDDFADGWGEFEAVA